MNPLVLVSFLFLLGSADQSSTAGVVSSNGSPPSSAALVPCIESSDCRLIQSPRGELRNAEIAFLAVSLRTPMRNQRESVPFRVEKAWRSDLAEGSVVNVWLRVDCCAQGAVESGKRYLVYAKGPRLYPSRDEPISPSQATAVAEERGADLIEFLGAEPAEPVAPHELLSSLDDWKSGAMSTQEMVRWFHVAYVQREPVDPLTREIVESMNLFLRLVTRLNQTKCVRAEAVANAITDFIRQNPHPGRDTFTSWQHLFHEFGTNEGYNDCTRAKGQSRNAPPNLAVPADFNAPHHVLVACSCCAGA